MEGMMRVITVLNQCTEFKRFVFEGSRLDEHGRILVSLRPRKNSKAECSGCGQLSPTYDTAAEPRLFEFVPLWGFSVYLSYRMRRVSCHACDRVVVEKVPWSTGKHHLSDIYRCFLARWARKLSWTEVARSFRSSWDQVYHSVQYVVEYGLAHRRLDQVTALGVDEVQFGKGHQYLTLLYQIDTHRRRLLWMGEKRTKKTLDDGFTALEQEHRGKQEAAGVEKPTRFLDGIAVICSDIWKAYLTVIAKRLPTAVHILDRFHIMQHFSKALDKVRAEEARRLKEEGLDPVLTKSRWCFLKRTENLTEKQGLKLSELLQMNLRTVKAYLLKEDFQRFWDYTYPAWADRFLHRWCFRTMRSKIDPMKKIAQMLRRHEVLILNWFRAKKRFNNGIVEGLNLKWNLTVRKAFGFRTFNALQIASFHQLGDLPEPPSTHEFY
jgi:transposase